MRHTTEMTSWRRRKVRGREDVLSTHLLLLLAWERQCGSDSRHDHGEGRGHVEDGDADDGGGAGLGHVDDVGVKWWWYERLNS